MLLLTWHDSSAPTKEPVYDSIILRSFAQHEPCKDSICESVIPRSGIDSFGLSHDEFYGIDDLNLNSNKPVDLNGSQNETQSKLPVSEEPDVGKTHKLVMEEVRTQEPIVEKVIVKDYVSSKEDAKQENEIVELDIDVHLFCISMDVPFDNICVTNLVPYDVLEGEDVDVINLDGFDSDLGNDNETSNYRRKSPWHALMPLGRT
ncbi:hypothetical protein Tco_1296953 [Tanacetum coccineum]